MKILIKRFGEILTSRPEGREAALVLLASELRVRPPSLELDFEGVLVMTPSWLGEFLLTLESSKISSVQFLNTTNASVKSSIEFTQAV
jgi:hypothetical protein